MIQLINISKSYGHRTLFEEVSFTLGQGEKVGLVGRNGAGKSTLFRMITGAELPDYGQVKVPPHYKIATLEQHLKFSHSTVHDEAVSALRDEERYDHYKAEKILMGLGFDRQSMMEPPESFSGGYQIRIMLTKALLGSPDLLLLDEPTNYLDIVSLRWLKNFLHSFRGEIMLITHDRDFMDGVINHTLGIRRHSLRKIPGPTAKYYEQMNMEDQLHEQTRQNQEKKRRELQQFIDRFRAKASKATQAQSRVKQLEKMDTLEALSFERSMGLPFRYAYCPSKVLMRVDKLAFGYDSERFLFDGLTFQVEAGDRIAIIGKNGHGKSTLLNVLAGELSPNHGSISIHPAVQPGHFGQTNVDRLHRNQTIVAEISAENPELSLTEVRGICGAMMFEGDDAEKKIDVLSGGERSRVLLGKLLAKPTNLLLLDEPTNHLDMESVEVLTAELETYEGAIVLVTHNEAMLRALASKLIVFREGTAELFLGGYDDFLNRLGWMEEAAGQDRRKAKKLSKKERADLIARRGREMAPLQKQVERSEQAIIDAEAEISRTNASLVAASESGSASEIADLSKRIQELEASVESNFSELERASADLERIRLTYEKLLP